MEVINHWNHGMFSDSNLNTTLLCVMIHRTNKKKRKETIIYLEYEEVLGFFLFSDLIMQDYSTMEL